MRKILVGLMCLGCALALDAQVYPGDANDDGIVNNFDVLYVGYAYGKIGPARLVESSEFAEQYIPLLWDDFFPSGINYAFCDANGNGQIGNWDLSVIFINYGEEQGTFNDLTPEAGVPGIDPPIYFGTPQSAGTITEGSQIQIPIYLGTASLPLTDFHSIAFSVRYDETIIRVANISVHTTWLETPNLFYFQRDSPVEDGKLDFCLTHYGAENFDNGFGQIGYLKIIIEDVLVDLILNGDSTNTILSIDQVMAVDKDFEIIPISTDTTEIAIYEQNAITGANGSLEADTTWQINPNPAKSHVFIQSAHPVEQFILCDNSGQSISTWSGNHHLQHYLELPEHLPSGLYHLRMLCNGQWQSKALLVHKD
ncbi:MAG TPA: hypothetical protein PKA00_12655 [Saprospiraceae bacterium]|nr:hypothetical protein [Saprospiraceae bacterium]HMQ83759.1 hypothetical protein [Saprospiraceae bacterium]